MRSLVGLAFAAVAISLSGCSEEPAANKKSKRVEYTSPPRTVEDAPEGAPVAKVFVSLPKPPDAPANAPAPEGQPAPVPTLKEAAAGARGAATPVKNGPPVAANNAKNDVPSDAEKLDVGFTGKGQYGDGQYLTEVVSTYFGAQERILMMQIEHNLDLFKAAHDNKPPKTQEEYMKEIIVEGGVDLPELPPGKRYVYNPKTGELMVASEKKK